MALVGPGQAVELREVVLRDKPKSMLKASTKGTVPVLVQPSGDVVDESLDVMLWALERGDPDGWLSPQADTRADMMALIAECDGPFKHHLDRFKYATRYEGADPAAHREEAGVFLDALEKRLGENAQLFGGRTSLADIAIFPFVRQFANAAGDWFNTGRFTALQRWLGGHTSSTLFASVMVKYPQWQEGEVGIAFPPVDKVA